MCFFSLSVGQRVSSASYGGREGVVFFELDRCVTGLFIQSSHCNTAVTVRRRLQVGYFQYQGGV